MHMLITTKMCEVNIHVLADLNCSFAYLSVHLTIFFVNYNTYVVAELMDCLFTHLHTYSKHQLKSHFCARNCITFMLQ